MESAVPRFFSMFHILAARRSAFLNNFGISVGFSILRFEKHIRADGVCPPSTFLSKKAPGREGFVKYVLITELLKRFDPG